MLKLGVFPVFPMPVPGYTYQFQLTLLLSLGILCLWQRLDLMACSDEHLFPQTGLNLQICFARMLLLTRKEIQGKSCYCRYEFVSSIEYASIKLIKLKEKLDFLAVDVSDNCI